MKWRRRWHKRSRKMAAVITRRLAGTIFDQGMLWNFCGEPRVLEIEDLSGPLKVPGRYTCVPYTCWGSVCECEYSKNQHGRGVR